MHTPSAITTLISMLTWNLQGKKIPNTISTHFLVMSFAIRQQYSMSLFNRHCTFVINYACSLICVGKSRSILGFLGA